MKNQLKQTLEILSRDIFTPWSNKQNQLNKLYFATKGGIQAIVNIVNNKAKISSKILKWVGTALWNFAETSAMIEALWRDKAVNAIMVLLNSGQPPLEKVAMGFLMCLFEYDTNAELASNHYKDIVSRITSIAKKNDKYYKSLEFRQVIIGTLCTLSIQPVTRYQLLTLGGLDILLDSTDCEVTEYFRVIGIAHFLLDENSLKKKKKQLAVSKVSEFSKSFEPLKISQIEDDYGIIWTSLKSFFVLLEARDPIVQIFATLCLTGLSFRQTNQDLFCTENLLDKLCGIIPWHPESRVRKYGPTLVQNQIQFKHYVVPSLVSFCEFNIKYKHRAFLLPQYERLKHLWKC